MARMEYRSAFHVFLLSSLSVQCWLYGRRTKLLMTNDERRERRYERRQEKRARNREARAAEVGTIGEAFTYRGMFHYGRKCCNGVRWKQSVQNFERHLFSRTAVAYRRILAGTWKGGTCSSFTLCERGKVRNIDAPQVADRQVHKALVNEVLIPLYRPHMIADNPASRQGGGLHWQYRRIKKQLQRHFRRHGRNGAVLLLDLKGFFPNANRQLVYERHAALIADPRLRALADTVVREAPETSPGRGMPLGMEPAQIEMTALPTAMDQWLKCQCGIAACGHYMDDYYIICEDEDRLRRVGDELMQRFEDAGIPVNRNKYQIVPLTKPFRFCKSRFTLTETGRVIINRCRNGVKRARRKLKMFRRQLDEGRCTMADVEQFMRCQLAYYNHYNDHGRVLRLKRLYHALFSTTGGGPNAGC